MREAPFHGKAAPLWSQLKNTVCGTVGPLSFPTRVDTTGPWCRNCASPKHRLVEFPHAGRHNEHGLGMRCARPIDRTVHIGAGSWSFPTRVDTTSTGQGCGARGRPTTSTQSRSLASLSSRCRAQLLSYRPPSRRAAAAAADTVAAAAVGRHASYWRLATGLALGCGCASQRSSSGPMGQSRAFCCTSRTPSRGFLCQSTR
jgi:hypothetical protein